MLSSVGICDRSALLSSARDMPDAYQTYQSTEGSIGPDRS